MSPGNHLTITPLKDANLQFLSVVQCNQGRPQVGKPAAPENTPFVAIIDDSLTVRHQVLVDTLARVRPDWQVTERSIN